MVTFAGLQQATPSWNAASHHVILLTRYALVSFGPPAIIDLDSGIHFTSKLFGHGLWNMVLRIISIWLANPKQPERHNCLLKDMLLKILNGMWPPQWIGIVPQTVILLNSLPLCLQTPYTNHQSFPKAALLLLASTPLLWHWRGLY